MTTLPEESTLEIIGNAAAVAQAERFHIQRFETAVRNGESGDEWWEAATHARNAYVDMILELTERMLREKTHTLNTGTVLARLVFDGPVKGRYIAELWRGGQRL